MREHKMLIGESEIRFGEPDRAEFERFAEFAQKRCMSMMNIQAFLANVQAGKIDFAGVTEKQEKAFDELEKALLELRDKFYAILANSSAFIGAEMMTKAQFMSIFDFSELTSANRLQEGITAYIAELAITDAEVKN